MEALTEPKAGLEFRTLKELRSALQEIIPKSHSVPATLRTPGPRADPPVGDSYGSGLAAVKTGSSGEKRRSLRLGLLHPQGGILGYGSGSKGQRAAKLCRLVLPGTRYPPSEFRADTWLLRRTACRSLGAPTGGKVRRVNQWPWRCWAREGRAQATGGEGCRGIAAEPGSPHGWQSQKGWAGKGRMEARVTVPGGFPG
ncbi:hypothetical protein DNTS_026357, partial [Danionella cerebrum]